MNVLQPNDAAELYRMLHRGPVLVAAFSSAFISTDPSRDPPTKREARSLESFVAYKATYGLLRADRDVTALFERFAQWNGNVRCDGPADPRVLPLHVFDRGSDDVDLDTSAGAEHFRRGFGAPGRRLDRSGRIWSMGVAHGREALRVAGCDLPPGVHWDVSVKQKASLVANANEIWRIDRDGYLNVYPDAGIRGPANVRRKAARRVWPSRGQKMPLHIKGH